MVMEKNGCNRKMQDREEKKRVVCYLANGEWNFKMLIHECCVLKNRSRLCGNGFFFFARP